MFSRESIGFSWIKVLASLASSLLSAMVASALTLGNLVFAKAVVVGINPSRPQIVVVGT